MLLDFVTVFVLKKEHILDPNLSLRWKREVATSGVIGFFDAQGKQL
jgi:hypothetical protein